MKDGRSLKELTPAATLSQIMAADQQAAELLASIGLNPADHKEETLQSVCQRRQWSEHEVLQWLKNQYPSKNATSHIEQDPPRKQNYGDDLSRWCHYLEEVFHQPALELLQEIDEKFPRVKKIHGNQYPWIKDMEYYTKSFLEDFRLYLMFESKKFFPLVRKIDEKKQKVLDGTVRKLWRSLDIIEQDQQRLRQAVDTIRDKGNDFKNPGGACSTFRILNHQFKRLDISLEKQFEIEREHILPLVEEKLNAV